jgi:predicted metal-binding protein
LVTHSAECKENQLIAEILNKQQCIENLEEHYRRMEAECAPMAQKIAKLEEELLKQQTTQIKYVNCSFAPMRSMGVSFPAKDHVCFQNLIYTRTWILSMRE